MNDEVACFYDYITFTEYAKSDTYKLLMIMEAIQFVLHIGPHIANIAEQYGTLVYFMLFIIVFCEVGVILTPFLPGDSMIFVTGALAATGKLDIRILVPSMVIAAILGYAFNFWMGQKFAHKVIAGDFRWIKREYLIKTEKFYEKYGPKAVVLARFMPFTRTYAPFLAGVGKMSPKHFTFYNIFSAFLWIGTITACGYFFGNIPIIQNNFTYVIFFIIIVSLLPIVIEYFKAKKAADKDGWNEDTI